MRVALDATPLLDPVSGVPVYCRELLGALTSGPDADALSLRLVAFSLRGRLPDLPGTVRSPVRVPARVLRAAWSRADLPPVELLAGRCDVFHGTNFVSPPSRAAAVVTVHDLGYVHRPETVRAASVGYDALLRRALDRGPLVVAVPSAAVGAQVREHYGLAEDRVVVTPLAPRSPDGAGPVGPTVPAAGAGSTGSTGPDVPSRYLLFVGTVEPRKNLATLVRAQRLAAGRDPEHPVLVVVGAAGWGARADEDPATLVLGRVDDAALHRLLAGCAGLVMPSLDEGFGLPVIEAAAAGRPVAASDIPVMREVCAPGTLFTPPSDVEGWAHTLAALAGGPDVEADRAARRAHAATFSWRRCAEQTVAAYRRAVDLRG